VTGWAWVPEELWLIGLALAVGIFAALLPALRAYRTDIAGTLARG
jgi:putative ABC transport system permease protein